jgi:hypothetical protein
MDDKETALPCANKIAFDTQKEAQAAATLVAHRYGSRLKPYRCTHCDLWHLASN